MKRMIAFLLALCMVITIVPISVFAADTTGSDTKTEENPVPDHEHDYISVETDPTCTEAGYITYTCACGDSYKEDGKSALGHTELVITGTQATCTESGWTDGSYCNRCSLVLKKPENIPALGHDYVDEICTVCGEKEYFILASGECGEKLTWVLGNDGVLIISGTGDMEDYDEEQKVSPWEKYRAQITAVKLEEDVTSIGAYAFQECAYLTNVDIPERVAEIGSGAFEGCIKLTNVAIPDGVTDIKYRAFSNCTDLTEVVIPDRVTSIGRYAFDNCENLTDIYYGGTDEEWSALSNRPDAAYIHYECTEPENHWTEMHVNPTCTEEGHFGEECSCDYERNVEEIPALGHDEIRHEAVSVTCTTDGKTEGISCKRCGEVMQKQEIIPAPGHAWDEGVVTKEPSKKEAGIQTFTCTVCDETKTEEIPYIPPELKISRVSGAGRAETAIEVADQMKAVLNVEKFEAVVLANGDAFADALAGSYLASKKNAPILLRRSSGASDDLNEAYICENLVAGGTIYLLGGTAANPETVEESLSALGYNVVRLAGDNRFDTNLKILEEAGISAGEEILVTTGWEFADCLSASASGKPILMLNTIQGELAEAQIAFLEMYADNDYTIIGGTAAISEAMAAAIEAIVGEVDRISGSTREETSVQVAKTNFEEPECVLIAYSRNFPDGLCGGPLAYKLGVPLLLVNVGQETPAAEYIAENVIRNGIVLGGTDAVGDETVQAIFGE